MQLQIDDGGRAAAGYKGYTGDCVCRAIAIVMQRPYQEIYDLIIEFSKGERLSARRTSKSHPRTGVRKATTRKIMAHLGLTWVPVMKIGSGCTMHLSADELPRGRLVVSLSGHTTAVIDGVAHDTYDPSRAGTRCVYGYWT